MSKRRIRMKARRAAVWCQLTLGIAVLGCAAKADSKSEVEHRDFFVDGEPGIHLFVREVSHPGATGDPILLVHGARVPGLASFDLAVPGGSLAADLARSGFDVYVADLRGYGQSTRPKEMDQPPGANPPLVRSNEAARDIAAVVDAIRSRTHTAKVAIFGWATGGQWAGYYASLYPDRVRALILLNSLYRGTSPQPLIGHGTDSEDSAHPGHFNQANCGAYRLNDAVSLLRPWDRSIPLENKDEWRDPAVARAYVDGALASDPTSKLRTPPSFRSPCGAMEDSFDLAIGRQMWDASLITAPTLILASEKDFWSRPEDRENLAADLIHSPKVQVVVIRGATHFVHLDRPERGRSTLLDAIIAFLHASRRAPQDAPAARSDKALPSIDTSRQFGPTMILWNTGLVETITPASLGGRDTWRITHYPVDPTQTSSNDYDLYDLDRETLAPLRSVRNTDEYHLELTFAEREVTLHKTSNKEMVEEKIPLTMAVKPEGPGLDLFVAALALSAGYKMQYAVVDRWGGHGSGRLKTVSLSVSQALTGDTPLGKLDLYDVLIQPEDNSFRIHEKVLANGPHFPVWVEYTRDGRTYPASQVVAINAGTYPASW